MLVASALLPVTRASTGGKSCGDDQPSHVQQLIHFIAER
jgi:hypothetical protein